MTTTTNNQQKINMSGNVNKEITADYKIFMIMNDDTKEFYISQTTNKYLSTTISDMKRRKSKLTENIFNGDYTITLLEVMKTTNLYFVKNRVNELIKAKKTEATSIKTLDGRGKHTKTECDECEEETEEETEEDTDEEEEVKPKKKTTTKAKVAETTDTQKTAPKYKCECCDKMEYVKNKTRHEKTNKHIKNSKK